MEFKNVLDDSSSSETSSNQNFAYPVPQPAALKFENTFDNTEQMELEYDSNSIATGHLKPHPLVYESQTSESDKHNVHESEFTFKDEIPPDLDQGVENDTLKSSSSKEPHRNKTRCKSRFSVRWVWLHDFVTHISSILFAIPVIVLSAIDLANSATYHHTHYPHSTNARIPTTILILSVLSILSSTLAILYATTYLTFMSAEARTRRLPRRKTTFFDLFLWLFFSALAETNLSLRVSEDSKIALAPWGAGQAWRQGIVIAVGVLQNLLLVAAHVRWSVSFGLYKERKRLRKAGIEMDPQDEENSGEGIGNQDVPEIKYVH